MAKSSQRISILTQHQFVERIVATLKFAPPVFGDGGGSPYTLVLGSGFSHPVIPTGRGVIAGIPDWLEHGALGVPCSDAARREFWQRVHGEVDRTQKDADSQLNQLPLRSAERDAFIRPTTLDLDPKTGTPPVDTGDQVNAAYVAAMLHGLGSPAIRRAFVRALVRAPGPQTTAGHFYLASILQAQQAHRRSCRSHQAHNPETCRWPLKSPFCSTIFTTNFDLLLQSALQLEGVLYSVTDRPDTLEPPNDADRESLHLVYTHGSVQQMWMANTEAEIVGNAHRQARKLPEYFKRHGVIVIGYSGWADACMAALSECDWFDHNLYWCIRETAQTRALAYEDRMAKIRSNVRTFLEDRAENAFFVSIDDADSLMGDLHRRMGLEIQPRIISHPLNALLDNLPELPPSEHDGKPTSSQRVAGSSGVNDILEENRQRLKMYAAHWPGEIGEDEGPYSGAPPLPEPPSTTGVSADDLGESPDQPAPEAATREPAAAREQRTQLDKRRDAAAKYRKQMADAEWLYWTDKKSEAIKIWTQVSEDANAPVEQRAQALFNRGVTYRQLNQPDRAIADYNAVLALPDAPAEQQALALVNRGAVYGQPNQPERAIADYDAVLAMPDAPAELRAQALVNRGALYGQLNQAERAIADYDAALAMPDAPAEQRAQALVNRGVAYGKLNQPEREIADYETVLAMPDAPVEQRARALINRGVAYDGFNQPERAIADYDAVLAMQDTPAEQRARALINRGVAYVQLNQPERAIADYAAVLAMPDAPVGQRARALSNRGVTYDQFNQPERAIADYDAVLAMADAPMEQRAKALMNRGWWFYNRETPDVGRFVADTRESIGLNPSDGAAQANLGLGLLLSGDLTGSLDAYRQALALAKSDRDVQMWILDDLAAAQAKRGPFAGADEIIALAHARIRELGGSPPDIAQPEPSPSADAPRPKRPRKKRKE